MFFSSSAYFPRIFQKADLRINYLVNIRFIMQSNHPPALWTAALRAPNDLQQMFFPHWSFKKRSQPFEVSLFAFIWTLVCNVPKLFSTVIFLFVRFLFKSFPPELRRQTHEVSRDRNSDCCLVGTHPRFLVHKEVSVSSTFVAPFLLCSQTNPIQDCVINYLPRQWNAKAWRNTPAG